MAGNKVNLQSEQLRVSLKGHLAPVLYTNNPDNIYQKAYGPNTSLAALNLTGNKPVLLPGMTFEDAGELIEIRVIESVLTVDPFLPGTDVNTINGDVYLACNLSDATFYLTNNEPLYNSGRKGYYGTRTNEINNRYLFKIYKETRDANSIYNRVEPLSISVTDDVTSLLAGSGFTLPSGGQPGDALQLNNAGQPVWESPGSTGPEGPTGPAGRGVPADGATDDILIKNSAAPYDTRFGELPVKYQGRDGRDGSRIYRGIADPNVSTTAGVPSIPVLGDLFVNTMGVTFYQYNVDTEGWTPIITIPLGAKSAFYWDAEPDPTQSDSIPDTISTGDIYLDLTTGQVWTVGDNNLWERTSITLQGPAGPPGEPAQPPDFRENPETNIIEWRLGPSGTRTATPWSFLFDKETIRG